MGVVAARRSFDLFPGTGDTTSAGSVMVAFAVNVLVAVAKTIAAALTASASMLAEAAHSWADCGNEVFLMIANRRSRRAPDTRHPLGSGKEAYFWALFAALGLLTAGGAVSVMRGVQELLDPATGVDFVVAYAVLALSFVLEAFSLTWSIRRSKREAASMHRDLLEHILATSDPTLRAVVAEDAAALVGLILASGGLVASEVTNSTVPDAIASILIGVLLGVVALTLINRNRRFLIGEEVDPRVRGAALRELLANPAIARVTYLRLEIVGPRAVLIIGDVDLTGDDVESILSVRLRTLESTIRASPAVAGAVLSLSAPDEPSLVI
ncbi:MAG: cation diffusion facilitator family transporter [Mycolicibacterium sp.]|nr:cation diffusion facilitator family transporter [Mycolicibacterium sp.]